MTTAPFTQASLYQIAARAVPTVNQCEALYIINRRLHIIKLCLYIIAAFAVHFLLPQSFFRRKMTAPSSDMHPKS